jgi:hypothetical protein
MTPHRSRELLTACAASVLVACRDSAPPDETVQLANRLGRALEAMPAPIRVVPPRELCVTSGRLHPMSDGRWFSTRPTLRATAPPSAGQHAAVTFRYLGSAEKGGADASRQQLGLELLSRDSCNSIHVTWRLDEPAFVVAFVKSNPDFTRDSYCAERGARNLRPFWKVAVEPPEAGSVQELSAVLERGLLEVRIDRLPVLRAVTAGYDVPAFGRSGLRADNVDFELIRFEADVPETRAPSSTRCGSRADSAH